MKPSILINTATLVFLIGFFYSVSASDNPDSKKKQPKTDTLFINMEASGLDMTIYFKGGEQHNYPSFVLWLEDLEGNYIQTLFVTRSIGTGIFNNADAGNGRWKNVEGESIRPAALPYWGHKRGIESRGRFVPTPENPVPDAYTGATPGKQFIAYTRLNDYKEKKFRILMEINQPWDWNEFWSNDKFPGNLDYQSSCQPSVVYGVTVNLENDISEYFLNPIGHGHFAGKTPLLYTDLSTLTTALQIVDKVKIEIADSND